MVLDYSVKEVDIEKGQASLILKFGADVYLDVDEGLVKESVRGKSINDAEYVLNALPEIKEVEIKHFPFWMNKFPSSSDKIEIQLIINNAKN